MRLLLLVLPALLLFVIACETVDSEEQRVYNQNLGVMRARVALNGDGVCTISYYKQITQGENIFTKQNILYAQTDACIEGGYLSESGAGGYSKFHDAAPGLPLLPR